MPSLFYPIRVGEWDLPNRMVMSPLTRCRSSGGRIPNEMMAEYYRQRSTAGLIISEATSISPMGVGYPHTPGIWSAEQIEGWKLITEAVHEEDCHIVLQLWHVGRISDPSYLNGALPVAPSTIAAKGHVSLLHPQKPYVTPRALEYDEILGIIEDYRTGAQNAFTAGFDGVEIHGANGYLLDQFLHSGVNHRTDIYGGSIENRARLMLQVLDAAIGVWGGGRVGLHLSPCDDMHDVSDADPLATYDYVAREAGSREIAFICARETRSETWLGPHLKKSFGGVYIANELFTKETGQTVLDAGEADAVAYGQLFTANPDLPRRFLEDTSLNEPDPSTFYTKGPHGYIDYPTLDTEHDEMELALDKGRENDRLHALSMESHDDPGSL
jgi:2,4-dienoyl-CoA reductase-like NADH-dependent reductase (Old Yellow Enzyme family)